MNSDDFRGDRGGDDGARDREIRDAAARWVVRQDRGLSAEEKAELEAWLAADSRHGEALEGSAASWRAFRELGDAVRRAPDAGGPARARWRPAVMGGWAAAALVVLAAVMLVRPGERAEPDMSAVTPIRAPVTRRLTDGSVARLKDGAEIAEAFTAGERRIRLIRGEAFFTVAKDAARPFFVEVDHVTVRAVGTAFAVRFETQAVNVLVTEGTVQVTPTVTATAEAAPALVGAGHRAVVARTPVVAAQAVVVSAVSAKEIAHALAWNEPMLELAGATLGELVGEFGRRTGQRIEVGDAALRGVRMGGQFPTNDLDGFLRALAEIYDVKVERRPDGVIVLRMMK